MRTLRQIVAGTDFSDGAEQALKVAIELALSVATPARITLVHVCELGVDELDERRLRRCGEALAEAVARHRLRRVQLAGILRSGTPWEKLDNVAVEVGASLVVVGRHGAGRGQTLHCRGVELGFVAAHLVRFASRPVLTVPCDLNRLDLEAAENKHQ